jgi:hypothetical protein
MIPRTYPSRVNSTTGRVEALVSFISSTTGLQRWVDYTPVAFVTDATPVEGSYNNNGYIAVADVGSTTGLQAGKDYIRVFLDPNATDAWRVNSVGFIPVGYSGIGGIPYALFANNEQGVWYDPSDFSTMFQDSAGTTPVTAVEQPVGLMLDKSKGLVLGSELVTNGSFDSDASWNKGPGWSISDGAARANTSGVAALNQTLSISAGKSYRVQFTTTVTSGNISSFLGGASIRANFTSGTYSIVVVAGAANTALQFETINACVATIDNISVRELPGNHAFQATSTSRPVLSARYNLLTKTEQFDDAAWTKTGSAATFEKINETAVSSAHFVSQGFSTGSYLISVELKAAEREYAFVGNVEHAVSVNLATGTASAAVGTPTNIVTTRLSDGHLRVSFTATYSVTTGLNIYPSTDGIWGNRSYLGVAGNGIYARKADLRVTNDAAGQPAYQRVNTATDYDTTGFKPYLRFDGTDDWMQTNNINFTATDKMTVFAGVRKLSDAATAIICEFSPALATNAGSFYFAHSSVAARGDYMFASRGSTFAQAITGNVYQAPTTDVLSGSANISGDSIVLRVDGTQAATETGDQGTGNYGNYPLYIGRRGGTTLPFNGRIYGLIVRGAVTTTATIQATETYMNGKTGAY